MEPLITDVNDSELNTMLIKVRKLISYIKSLSGFQLIKPEMPGPYCHMGATITDAMLQAGTTWKTVVKPRIERLLKYSEAKRVTGFSELLNKEGTSKVLLNHLGLIFSPKNKLGADHFARESAFKIASTMVRLSTLKGIL